MRNVLQGLSVIYPVFNEEKQIVQCIDEAKDLILKIGFAGEIIFVDDCSSDNSKGLIQHYQATNYGPISINLIQNENRMGCHKSVMAGIRASNFTKIAWFPSDLQIKPTDAATILEKLDYFDLVHTFRGVREDNFLRIIMGKAWSFVCRIVTGLPIKDFDSVTFFNFRASKLIFEDGIEFISTNTGNSPEVLLRAKLKGLNFTQSEIKHYPRTSGSPSAINLNEIFKSFFDLMRLRGHYFSQYKKPRF